MRRNLLLLAALVVAIGSAVPSFSQSNHAAGFGVAYSPDCGCQPKRPSEISVTVQDAENDVEIGTPMHIQAVVEPTQGGPTPTGEVDFYFGTYNFASADLHNNEADVILDTRHVPPGVISIYAIYRGDSNYTGSTSNVATFTLIGQPNSQTSLAISPSSVHQGASVTMTADVQPREGGSSPTGQVLFFSGSMYLGSAYLNGTVASLTRSTASVPLGKYSVYAIYAGDNNYVASRSPLESITVTH